MLVALLALFFAIGGPAQARRLINGADIRKGTIRSAQIKDRTIAARDLSTAARTELRATADGSITAAKLAAGAVTAGALSPGAIGGAAIADGAVSTVDLADGAVTGGKLADSAVTGAKVADGTLTAADMARFSGAFRILTDDLGTILPHDCWNREPRGLAPEAAGADISQDALLVVPRSTLNTRQLTFSYRMSGPSSSDPASASRFVLALCNVTDLAVTPPSISFSYVVFDIP
jgi:hypothetical protein